MACINRTFSRFADTSILLQETKLGLPAIPPKAPKNWEYQRDGAYLRSRSHTRFTSTIYSEVFVVRSCMEIDGSNHGCCSTLAFSKDPPLLHKGCGRLTVVHEFWISDTQTNKSRSNPPSLCEVSRVTLITLLLYCTLQRPLNLHSRKRRRTTQAHTTAARVRPPALIHKFYPSHSRF